MFLNLSHTKTPVYIASKRLVNVLYQFTSRLPPEEKFGLATQIRRAAVSIVLNVAEGCSRKSRNERKRFFEVARGSLIEIDTALEIAIELKLEHSNDYVDLNEIMLNVFKQLSGLINSINSDN